jgi:hypothetical protein
MALVQYIGVSDVKWQIVVELSHHAAALSPSAASLVGRQILIDLQHLDQ